MKTANVSFGNVVAVSGKRKLITNVNYKMETARQQGKVLIQDITSQYLNASSGGMLANEAQKGNDVYLYITGNDISALKNNSAVYNSIDGVISSMKEYLNLNKTPWKEAMAKIFAN